MYPPRGPMMPPYGAPPPMMPPRPPPPPMAPAVPPPPPVDYQALAAQKAQQQAQATPAAPQPASVEAEIPGMAPDAAVSTAQAYQKAAREVASAAARRPGAAARGRTTRARPDPVVRPGQELWVHRGGGRRGKCLYPRLRRQ